MIRIEPAVGTKCRGPFNLGCPHGAGATHSFIVVTDFDVESDDRCSECYEAEVNHDD